MAVRIADWIGELGKPSALRSLRIAAIVALVGACGLSACTGPGLEPPGDSASGGNVDAGAGAGTGGNSGAGGVGGTGGTGVPTTNDDAGAGALDGGADDAGYEDDAGDELR